MTIEDFFNSLSEDQKSTLKALLDESETPKQDLPEEHKQALNELDPAYHNSYLMTHNLEETIVNEDFTVERKVKINDRRSSVKAGKNNWVDDGAESKDVETPEFTRTPRRKSTPQKKEVDCHVCGRPFKIDPRHTYGEFHRCNKCTGR